MLDIAQGSAEWHAIRCGKVTASRVADVVATVKSGGYGASRATYMAELIAERLTGKPSESYTNAAMQWGTATEPEARTAYEFHANCDVQQVGFVEHPTIENAGCSPDGLLPDGGLVEIKCPNTAAHIETLLTGKIPEKYVKQMLFQMACTEGKWCDFVSYDPRLPEEMRLFVARVYRDQGAIDILEKEVRLFLADLNAKEKALRSQFMKEAA
ncbi:MAG: YqaJ viral recombinase family protein [Acidobacteriaceae bacterium]|nr:YqaJ viral recombinase family protein [Acidobacteriaceae bacterium]